MQFNLESYAVLWSPHQNAFQVETVQEMLEKNIAVFVEQDKGDFVVLGIANSRQEADQICSDLMSSRDGSS